MVFLGYFNSIYYFGCCVENGFQGGKYRNSQISCYVVVVIMYVCNIGDLDQDSIIRGIMVKFRMYFEIELIKLC